MQVKQPPLLRKKSKPKRLNAHQIRNLVREQQFDIRHPATEQPQRYRSLVDPHTTYFFASTPARKQLKHLKRVIAYEPNAHERNEVSRYINFRIRTNKIHDRNIRKMQEPDQDLSFDMTKIASSSVNSMFTLYKKFSEKDSSVRINGNKTNKPSFQLTSQTEYAKNMKKIDLFQEEALEASIINPQNLHSKLKRRMRTEPNERAQRLREELHKSKHLKWMTFLSNRKEQYLSKGPS